LHLFSETYGYSCMGLFLNIPLYSIGLCVCFCASTMLFLLLWLCSTIWSQTLCLLQHCFFCTGLLWLFRVLCASIWILGSFFSLFLWKMHENLKAIALTL
jgi:hypothetical protein